MEQVNVRKITAGFIFSWLVGVFLLLSSIVLFAVKSPTAAIIVIICSLFVIPLTNKVIAEKLHFQISGGLKALVALIGLIVYFSAFASSAFSSYGEKNKAGGKVVSEVQNGTSTADSAESVSKTPIVGCPNVIKEASKYNFHYSESTSGNTLLFLAAGFISEMQFSDGFELDVKPDTGNEFVYSSQSFICEKGSEQGQSTNKLYCRGSFMYKPDLKKKNIDKDGNVVSTERKGIENFIFDITGKDLNRANDLKSINKLESMTCE